MVIFLLQPTLAGYLRDDHLHKTIYTLESFDRTVRNSNESLLQILEPNFGTSAPSSLRLLGIVVSYRSCDRSKVTSFLLESQENVF